MAGLAAAWKAFETRSPDEGTAALRSLHPGSADQHRNRRGRPRITLRSIRATGPVRLLAGSTKRPFTTKLRHRKGAGYAEAVRSSGGRALGGVPRICG